MASEIKPVPRQVHQDGDQVLRKLKSRPDETSWIVRRAIESAYAAGYNDGWGAGHDEGWQDGKDAANKDAAADEPEGDQS